MLISDNDSDGDSYKFVIM